MDEPSLHYPDTLKRIRHYDAENMRTFIFSTKYLNIPALTIAQLFKERWKIEFFFKWIKQHLKTKAFYGNSQNAMYTQIWIALCIHLLLATAKKSWQIKESLYTMSQVVEFCILDKTTINELFSYKNKYYSKCKKDNQLILFNL